MTFRQKIYLILWAVLLAFLFNVFFGRYLSAKLSTVPFLKKLSFFAPQGPLVITTKEQIRVSDSGDVLNAIEAAKAKLSVIFSVESGQVKILGGAVNLTGDGDFITMASVVTGLPQNYFVMLSDGRTAQLQSKVVDPATGLVFVKANINNVPAAAIGNSGDLASGEKVVAILGSITPFTPSSVATFITSPENLVAGKTFNADQPSLGFEIKDVSLLKLPQAVVNLKGEVVGLWNGSQLISSDVIRPADNLYLKSTGKITRPLFGFTYNIITKEEAAILLAQEGAKVREINKAAATGLEVGDVILKVGNDTVSQDNLLENILQKFSSGDTITMQVLRGKQTVTLSYKLGELK